MAHFACKDQYMINYVDEWSPGGDTPQGMLIIKIGKTEVFLHYAICRQNALHAGTWKLIYSVFLFGWLELLLSFLLVCSSHYRMHRAHLLTTLKLNCLSGSLSKDKVRVVEGTAVVQDLREPAKLGVGFSYCKYCSSLSSSFLGGLSHFAFLLFSFFFLSSFIVLSCFLLL